MGTAALQKTTVLAVKGRRETFLICWFMQLVYAYDNICQVIKVAKIAIFRLFCEIYVLVTDI